MAHASSTTDLPGSPPPAPELDPGDEVFVAPTSFSQRRLFILDRIFPGYATYNVPSAIAISGPFAVAPFVAALAAAAERHEILRTSFGDEEQEPVQLIHPRVTPAVLAADLSALPEGRREAEELRLFESEAQRGFDLGRPPLLRTLVTILAPGRHGVLLNFHHIVIDAWSIDLLVEELFTIYGAAVAGCAPELPEIALQYADFAAWERGWLIGEALEQRLRPWRRRLEGAPVTLSLPTDRARPAVGTAAGGTRTMAVATAETQGLRDLARGGGATLFMAVLATYAAALTRFARQADLVVGIPVAGRNRTELEILLGCFVNTLPIRCDLSADPSFAGILAEVRAAVVEAFANQDIPFDKLVEEVRPDRRLAANPLYQVAFVYQQPEVPTRTYGALTVRPVELHSGTAKMDLSLHISENGTGLAGFWEWSRDLFDGVTVARFDSCFANLLDDALAHPGKRLSELEVLSAAARHQLVAEWNDSAVQYPRQATLPGLFAARVREDPEAPALVSATGCLSYGELDRESTALAAKLRALGVGIESRVGVCLERGTLLVVSFLAAVKAGAAYVPLDPGHPAERLAWMCEDADVAAVIGDSHAADRLGAGRPLLLLDGGRAAEGTWEPGAPASPDPEIVPENLAYVMYTSGSTGRPKGVAVPHRAVVRLVRETSYIRFDRGDRVAQQSNASFDVATFEIWGALLSGACLVVLEREVSLAPELLARTLARERIDVLSLTPALFNWVVSQEPAAFRTVRDLLIAGDALDPSSVAAVLAAGPPARLVNAYGPTETTTFASTEDVREVPAGALRLPIGRPLANGQLYVLDDGFGLLPPGVTGELYIGGDGLARGYFGQPDRTAERFLPDPFSGVPGSRLYRTGDLARTEGNGAVDCQGRVDSQVKIRGFRVEPLEIEAVLAAHPGLAAAAVGARRNGAGELALAAWYVGRGGASPAARELRKFLAAKVPEYMIPTFFVEMAGLPRTANGKLDRAALPEPAPASEIDLTPPQTPIEEMVAGIWADVLRIETIGRNDNFFDLGGHSLTATMVTAQVRSAFGVPLAARVLFEAPTLHGFAARLEHLLADAQGLELPPILPLPRTGEIPLTFAQERYWFLDRLAGGRTPYYNLASAVELSGRLHGRALARAIEEIDRRHEAVRTTFELGANRHPVQVIHPPGRRPLPLVDLGGLPEERRSTELGRLLVEEGDRPFSLARGPMLRTTLFRLAAERHTLTFALHHIAADGWTLALFLHELSALYRAFAAGHPSPLPRLPVQFADFALWQRRWLRGRTLSPHIDYWRQQLAGAPQAIDLADRPRPAFETFLGRFVRLELTAADLATLSSYAHHHQATFFMGLLTAWSLLIARYAGSDDLLIGTPIAARNRAEIAPLLGLFVNLLTLRIRLDGNPTLGELLGRVRETALAAYTHQDLPFELLAEELQHEPDLSRHPLFQISCSVESLGSFSHDLPGLRLAPLEAGNQTELFDLSLKVAEGLDGTAVRLSYKLDLFDRATIERMARQLERLLLALPRSAEVPIAELPLLSPEEEGQLKTTAKRAAITRRRRRPLAPTRLKRWRRACSRSPW